MLRKRLLEVSEWTGAYHLVNVKDHATKTTEKGGREELLQQLMASFIHLLPDMTIALSRADGPSLVVEGDFKSSALDTFRNGQCETRYRSGCTVLTLYQIFRQRSMSQGTIR